MGSGVETFCMVEDEAEVSEDKVDDDKDGGEMVWVDMSRRIFATPTVAEG